VLTKMIMAVVVAILNIRLGSVVESRNAAQDLHNALLH
jgi:hypothetical protein